MDEKQKEICDDLRRFLQTPTSTNGAHPPTPKRKRGWIRIPQWMISFGASMRNLGKAIPAQTKSIWQKQVKPASARIWKWIGKIYESRLRPVVLKFAKSVRIRTKYIWRRRVKPAFARILKQFVKSVRIRTKYIWRRYAKPALVKMWRRGGVGSGGWFGTILIVAFVAMMTFLINRAVRNTSDWYETINIPMTFPPINYLWWGLGAVVAIALLVRIGWLLRPAGIAVAIVIGIGLYRYLPVLMERMPTGSVSTPTRQPVLSAVILGLPADFVLPIIAECESGGRQFDGEGNLIVNEVSLAVGKYQIMVSLHEDRAKSLGFDIRTLEGNEAYARYLFSESGTRAWEIDPRSRACWEPKLFAKAGLPVSTQRTIVDVGVEWSEPVRLPTGRHVDLTPRTAVTYEMMTADGKVFTFPKITQAPIAVSSPLSPWFKLRSVDAESVIIDVVAYVPQS